MRNDIVRRRYPATSFCAVDRPGHAPEFGEILPRVDRSASKIQLEAADAGLFGTTSDIILSAGPLLLDVFNYYSDIPAVFRKSLAREYRAEQMTGKTLVPAPA